MMKSQWASSTRKIKETIPRHIINTVKFNDETLLNTGKEKNTLQLMEKDKNDSRRM